MQVQLCRQDGHLHDKLEELNDGGLEEVVARPVLREDLNDTVEQIELQAVRDDHNMELRYSSRGRSARRYMERVLP